MYDWGKPQFFGVRAAAANLGHGKGTYTVEQFRADYPQFFTAEGVSLLPPSMLCKVIDMANTAVQPDKWLDEWRFAVGLYTAHYVTLFLRGYSPSSETPQQAAASGALVGWSNRPPWGTARSPTTQAPLRPAPRTGATSTVQPTARCWQTGQS